MATASTNKTKKKIQTNGAQSNNTIDPFLASMTFATTTTKSFISAASNSSPFPSADLVDNVQRRQQGMIQQQQQQQQQQRRPRMFGCECCDDDECARIRLGVDVIPPSIRDAIQQYKRQKVQVGGYLMKRTQIRNLVCRQNPTSSNTNSTMAIWEWILPVTAEPIVEYKNPHIDRIIYIQRLPFALKMIGKGIIGSAAEEKSRRRLDLWKQGDVWYLKGACGGGGGGAIGFIHDEYITTNNTTTAATNNGNDYDFYDQDEALEETQKHVNPDDQPIDHNNIVIKNDNNNDSLVSAKYGANKVNTGPAVLYIIKIPTQDVWSTKPTSTTIDDQNHRTHQQQEGNDNKKKNDDDDEKQVTTHQDDNVDNETSEVTWKQAISNLLQTSTSRSPISGFNNNYNKQEDDFGAIKFNEQESNVIKRIIRTILKNDQPQQQQQQKQQQQDPNNEKTDRYQQSTTKQQHEEEEEEVLVYDTL